MNKMIEKVTAFITQRKNQRLELLLFNHPNVGIQIPASTVENGESIEEALLREVTEETGLKKITIKNFIGFKECRMSDNQFLISRKTKVYSRPDPNSFDWAKFRRETTIIANCNSNINEYIQITYREYNRYPDPQYVTYQITGWVPTSFLTNEMRRHYFHLESKEVTQKEWEKVADHHTFRLFWSPLTRLHEMVAPQRQWLEFVEENGFEFK